MNAISRSELWKKKLGDWVLNPYIGCKHGCVFCYCPAMPGVKFFNEGHSQAEWGEYVIEKVGIVEALRQQLKTFTPEKALRLGTPWGAGYVLLSFLTDCYQPLEATTKTTRQCLQLLLEAGHKVRIQTRSALVERDFDLLKAHRGQVLLGTSIPALDEMVTRAMEPHASGVKRRVEMLRRARNSAIPLYVAIAPVMPWTNRADLKHLICSVEDFLPQEIFCEVLNPKGSNLGMVAAALVGLSDQRAALAAYNTAVWARSTHDMLRVGWGQSAVFVPWPDTRRGWAKHLGRHEVAWLDQFLPPREGGQVAVERSEIKGGEAS